MNKLKLKTLNLLSIALISILIGIFIISIDSTLNPIKYTNGISSEQGQKIIITKLDIFNPTVTLLFAENPCPNDRSDIKQFEYVISHPRRQLSGLFLAANNILGISNCENLNDFLEIVKTKDLSLNNENPDVNRFRNKLSSGISKKTWFDQTEEERYYNPIDTENEAPKNIEEYKKLKIGMSWEEVIKTIGKCDMIIGTGVTKQKTEVICVVKNKGINFIALGWISNPSAYKKNQKLINAWVVYDDRRAEELKLETK
jgi:hypothetical protein